MLGKDKRTITLSAGEECTISSQGLTQVVLFSGVWDVAGVALEANKPYSFWLSPTRQSFVLYTLEGGTGDVTSSAAIEVHKTATTIAPLLQLTRRVLLHAKQTRILVIGNGGTGKTLAAHTIFNALRRYSAELESAVPIKTFAIDLNTQSNCLFSPACVSFTQVVEPFLWLGQTRSAANVTLSLFTGSAARPSTKTVNSYHHFSGQLLDTSMLYVNELCSPSDHTHVVIDVPSPQSNLSPWVFYKNVIENAHPTHVIIVGGRGNETDDTSWPSMLQEVVQRSLPDCNFVLTEALAHSRKCNASVSDGLCEYFIGTTFQPLGCAKVVVSKNDLQLVEFVANDYTDGDAIYATPCHVDRSLQSIVCALSHAELLDEVPLAPAVGLVIVVDVDDEHDELVLIVPSGETVLQRRFLIVPSMDERGLLRLSNADLAVVEEQIAV